MQVQPPRRVVLARDPRAATLGLAEELGRLLAEQLLGLALERAPADVALTADRGS
jgi:hypothetical protein